MAPLPYISRTDEGQADIDSCTLRLVELDPGATSQLLDIDPTDSEWAADLDSRVPEAEADCNWTLPTYRPQVLFVSLLDGDGDGRPDLVDGQTQRWHPNLGDGFDPVGAAVPATWPLITVYDAQGTAMLVTVLSSSRRHQMVLVDADATQIQYGETQSSDASTEVLQQVVDIDHDGVLDVVDAELGQIASSMANPARSRLGSGGAPRCAG